MLRTVVTSESIPEFSRTAFCCQLLQALTQPLTASAASRLCVEAWVQLGGATAACLIRPLSPSVLQTVTCRAVGGLSVEVAEVEESVAALLSGEAVRQIAPPLHSVGGPVSPGTGLPPAPPEVAELVQLWPELLAALVIAAVPTESTADAATVTASGRESAVTGLSSNTLQLVCRQLLGRATDQPLLFPQPDQLAAMAEFAAGAGHEINNPLASILGQTQLLLRSEQSIERRQALESIGAQAWRIRDMIGDTILFAQPPAASMQTHDLVQATREAVERSARNHAERLVTVEFRTAETQLLAECDRQQWLTLVSHLLRNGVEAVRSEQQPGTVTVMLRLSRRRAAVELVVRDSGPGIVDPLTRRHLFDPFYSGRQAGRGLGFGLSLCARIMQTHHGLLLHHAPGPRGAEFHAVLPLRQPDSRVGGERC